jgi:hypothetical protein
LRFPVVGASIHLVNLLGSAEEVALAFAIAISTRSKKSPAALHSELRGEWHAFMKTPPLFLPVIARSDVKNLEAGFGEFADG